MSWLTFLLAAIKALPEVIALISRFKASADAAKSEGIGYDRAVLETLQRANASMTIAKQVEAEAAKEHAAHDDDSAFDPEFIRKD